jgi:hypothetical protein
LIELIIVPTPRRWLVHALLGGWHRAQADRALLESERYASTV